MRLKTLLFSMVFFMSISAIAGGIEIPETIKRSFTEKFPNASKVKWDGNSQTQYEAGFVMDGREKIAVFLPDGTFKEIETEIKITEIPKRVLNAINKKYPLASVGFALKIQRNNNTIVYDLEINTGIEEFDVTLDSMGFEVD